MGVGKHLHLDVARVHDGALHQQVAIAKAGQRLGARAGHGLRQLPRLGDQAHAAPAASGHGLDHDGKANFCRLGRKTRLALVAARITRQAGHALLGGQRLGRGLVAQRANGRRRRADPDQAGVLHRLRKARILAQEAVAGVHRVGTGGLGGGQQLVHAQIAVGRRIAAERIGRGGLTHMQGIGIGVGIHRDGLNAHAVRGGDDAAGDFAAVGDEDFFHVCARGFIARSHAARARAICLAMPAA